jgi:hypothetical protein
LNWYHHMKPESPSSIPTASLLLAALALIGGYGAAVSVQAAADFDSSFRNEASQKSSQLAAEIHRLIKKAKQVENGFASIIKSMLARDPVRAPEGLDAQTKFEDLGRNLDSFRGMELTLRTAIVPEGLAEVHMDLRRAMARAREKIAITHSLFSQMLTAPESFESNVDGEGLRALAEHSTKRLIELANA